MPQISAEEAGGAGLRRRDQQPAAAPALRGRPGPYPHAIARQRFEPGLPLTSFRRTPKHEQQLALPVTMLPARKPTIGK